MLTIILTDELYDKFVKMIYDETGIFYEPNKKYYVEKRIEKRALTNEMDDLNDYYIMLKHTEKSPEFYKLINDLTVNETIYCYLRTFKKEFRKISESNLFLKVLSILSR